MDWYGQGGMIYVAPPFGGRNNCDNNVMEFFDFSLNAAFYRVKDGKDIVTIINNYFNIKAEEVRDACYAIHSWKDTTIAGMKFSSLAYKREKRTTCFKDVKMM